MPGEQHKGVDVLLRVGPVHGIDAQADVRRVLAGLTPARDLDQLDGALMQLAGEGGEAVPVGIGLLGDNLALLDQPLQYPADVKPVAPPLKAQGEVLEVDEDGQGAFPVSHNKPSGRMALPQTSSSLPGRPGPEKGRSTSR